MSIQTLNHSMTLTIPFPTPRLATIAQSVLNVDKELRSDQVKRVISTNDANLVVQFNCSNVKMLRVSVNSLLEMLIMVTKTIDAFDGME